MKNDYWSRRLANEYWNVYNDTSKYQKELIKIYNSASDEILEELYKISAKFEKNGVISRFEFYKVEHLKRMEKGFNDVLRELGEKIENKESKIILNAGEDVVKKTGKSLGIEINYNEDLAKKLMQTDWKGSTFSKRVWRNSKKLENELNTQVKKGILTGKPTSQIAIELDKSMGVGLSNSARLVRTETMHHMNDVNLQHMKSAGIQQVEEVVTLDERTSSECQPHHGRVWDIDKAPHLPRHPHCRCVLVAHIDIDKTAEEFDRKEAEIYADDKLSHINKIEPNITKFLKEVSSTENSELFGLDYKIKSKESLVRKIISDSKEKRITLKEATNQINDALRYTILNDEDSFTNKYFKIVEKMKAKGYNIIRVKNTFKQDVVYKSINTLVKNNGDIFELQFHTPKSVEVKEGGLHKLYEIQRSLNKEKDYKKWEALANKMIKLSNTIPIPKNIERIK